MSGPIFDWLEQETDKCLIPNLMEFTRIPNQSRNFDPNWKTNQLSQRACEFAINYLNSLNLLGLKITYVNETDQPPTLLIEVSGSLPGTILVYGHLDKQPPLTDLWRTGLHPYNPIIEEDRLYGRGVADDGFAIFEMGILLKSLQHFKISSKRFVLVFETDEESGSSGLYELLLKYKLIISTPDLVICLDAGAISYKHFTHCQSQRGIVNLSLKVEVLQNSIHSGSSGIVPDSFRLARNLLEQLESSENGTLVISRLNTEIPGKNFQYANEFVQIWKNNYDWKFPFLPGVEPTQKDLLKQVLNRTWKPKLTLIGIDGIPSSQNSGNVMRPYTTLQMSIRTPPNLDKDIAVNSIRLFFNQDFINISNAKITIDFLNVGNGFNAPPLGLQLESLLNEAAVKVFKNPLARFSSGGTIPILADIARLFPGVPILNTGISQTDSGAHAPNEFISINYLKKHLCALFLVLSSFTWQN